ncbi:MAG TPA: phosphoribosylformylglycinamidine synthase subunit PurQ [Hyphomicrobiaceae bacterium]|nr:phosphoribosylformylglycinamidine synthase subunit PurQ [Hyphomicrobiaceae bacterium]
MRASVIVFPGSNCDRDVKVALEAVVGAPVQMVWHGDASVPNSDLIVLPGGFSYGDYLRCGAMAAHSNVMRDVVAKAKAGTPVIGICNGFQILCETGLLPGVLQRNASLKFVCRDTWLKVEQTNTLFTRRYRAGEIVNIPVAHGDGNYFADADTLDRLEGDGLVVFRYVDPTTGEPTADANPNGAQRNIAGICSPSRRILGMMPHPERHFDRILGSDDGRRVFESVLEQAAA